MRHPNLRLLAGGLIGLFSAEAAVRLATHPAIDYASSYKPGPYCADDDLGISAVCPNAAVSMLVPGKKIHIDYRLDGYGHRGPFKSSVQGVDNHKSVMIIGGQSQGFGFGLADKDTFAGVAAEQGKCGPYTIHNIGIVGLNNAVSWHIFDRQARNPADHIILAVYWRTGSDRVEQEVARYKEVVGRRNAVLYGWMFSIPEDLPAVLRYSHLVVRGFSNAMFWLNKAWPTGKPDHDKRDTEAESINALRASILDAAERAERLGAKFSVVMLPNGFAANDAPVLAGLDRLRIVDINREVHASGLMKSVLADGHYAAPLAAHIGARIADEICEVNFPQSSKTAAD